MTTDTRPADRRDDLPSVARLLTLSDNVVAIALTLLVLQVRVPAHVQVARPDSAADLAAQLGKEADQLISYLVAFYVVTQFWLVHHRVFRHAAGHHEGLAWWNFAFLFTITALRFTSNLLGQYGDNPLAVGIFAVNLLLASLATQGTLLYGRRRDVVIPLDAAEVPGTPGAVDGDGDRRRLVGRPGVGERRRRQVVLAADPPRAVFGEPLVRPGRLGHKRGRRTPPVARPVGAAGRGRRPQIINRRPGLVNGDGRRPAAGNKSCLMATKVPRNGDQRLSSAGRAGLGSNWAVRMPGPLEQPRVPAPAG